MHAWRPQPKIYGYETRLAEVESFQLIQCCFNDTITFISVAYDDAEITSDIEGSSSWNQLNTSDVSNNGYYEFLVDFNAVYKTDFSVCSHPNRNFLSLAER
tara:strand:+ start:1168 stop:1470 length:303 start_codon:yes stop_codon:yes gene_type:complete